MEWEEGPPEAADGPEQPVRAALLPGVRVEPADFPVRNASAVMELPAIEGPAATGGAAQPVRLLVSRYGDSCLMVVATQLPTLGTMMWLGTSAAAGAASAGPAEAEGAAPRSRVLLGAHSALHDVAARRLAPLLAEAGWHGPVLLCLGLAAPSVEGLRALLPRLNSLAAQVLAQ